MAKDADIAKEVKSVVKKQKEEEKKKEERSGLEEVAKESIPDKAKKEISKTLAKAKEEKKEKSKEVKKEDKILEERVYTFNLKDAWKASRQKRTRTAVKIMKKLIKRHTKKEPKLHESLNSVMWKNSARNPPRKIKVKIKITETTATAYPLK